MKNSHLEARHVCFFKKTWHVLFFFFFWFILDEKKIKRMQARLGTGLGNYAPGWAPVMEKLHPAA